MASRRFLEVHKLTAEFEGGWSNHPRDPGGRTMYGITERVYHAWLASKGVGKKPVRNITMKEAEEIYYQNYWLAAKCDRLNSGVDRMVYDAAVNSGVGRSRKWLVEAVGSDNDADTVRRLHSIRMRFLRGLKTWDAFGRGWERRVNAMRDTALLEVNSKPVPKPEPEPEPVPQTEPQPARRSIFRLLADLILKLIKR